MGSKPIMVVQSLMILLLFVTPSYACSCVVRKHTPQSLCCSDYVLHGDVEKERLVQGNVTASEPPRTRIYTVKVKQIFRGLERIKNVTVDHNTSYVEIHTSSESASCGITLQLKESYLVSGSIDKNVMRSYSCSSWNTKWQHVPESYRNFFPQLKTCKCTGTSNLYAVKTIFLLTLLLTAYNI